MPIGIEPNGTKQKTFKEKNYTNPKCTETFCTVPVEKLTTKITNDVRLVAIKQWRTCMTQVCLSCHWPYKFNKPQWPYHSLSERVFLLRHFTPGRQWPYHSLTDRIFFYPVCETMVWSSMKQVSYSGKYSLSASGAHQSHLQSSFVVENVFCPCFYMRRYSIIVEEASRLQKIIVDEIDELYMLRENIYHYKKLVSYFYVLYSQVCISVP